ncbi:uncharacterized protein [Penaeus vannamei]|uniref:uncharacterized protein n=1 Tax=Penaeus vannamei TaxID=6689 RepID=UPI00387F6127
MAGWRRVVVAALLQLAFSRVLPADGNCYEGGELRMGLGYFTCSEPRLNFNDTQNELTMNFRNKNGRNVFTLSLNRTAGAFHLITHKDNKVISRTKLYLPDSPNELQLNITRSSVHAKTQGSWRKLDIPKTNRIFSFYVPDPANRITCCGGDIWPNNKTIDSDTVQNAEQGVGQSTKNTDQDVVQTAQNSEQGAAHTAQVGEQSVAVIMQWLSLSLVMVLSFANFFILWRIRKFRHLA